MPIHHTRRLALVAVAASLLAVPSLAAQEVETCLAGESLQGCYQRLVLRRAQPSAAPAEVGASARAAESNDLRGKAAGPDVSAAEAASAIRDFLPKFAASLILPGPTEDLSALGLRTNLPFVLNDGVLFRWGLTAQLGAVIHQAQPFAALVDSIPEGVREASRSRLEQGMQLYDDLSFTGALNAESGRMGRSFRSHQSVVQSLTEALLTFKDPTVDREREAAGTAYRQLVRRLAATDVDPARAQDTGCRFDASNRAELHFDCLGEDAQAAMERVLQRAARAESVWRREAERRIAVTGYNRLSELINNQPQLNGNFEYRARGEIAGPDEWTGKARFEMGFANMNGLRSFCAREAAAGAPREITLDCLQRYTSSPAVRRSLSRGHRVWTEVAVNRRPAYRVSLLDEGVEFSLDAATTLSAGGGYGAYFGNPEDGANRDRFDLQARYDFARDDVLRQDRAVATAFYTRHVSGAASAVLGLTWANRPEFVGDVDRKLQANLGLTYKLHQKDGGGTADGGSQ